MNSSTWKHNAVKAWIAVAILVIVAIIMSISLSSGSPKDKADKPPAGGSASCNLTKALEAEVQDWGFDLKDVSIDKINKSLPGARSNRSGSFSHKPLLSESELRQFLASDDDGAVETRMLLGNMKDIVWTPIQSEVPVVYEGMKIFVNGKSTSAGKVTVPKGDVIWVGTRDCKVVSLVRGACGNFVPQHPTPGRPPTGHPTPQPPCVKPPKPGGGGMYVYNPKTCTWHKPGQTFDQMQNQSPAHQDVQDNHTSGVNTGGTPNAGTGTSSPTSGGTGSAPTGGDSDGSGGTTVDNPPGDTGQGGDNDGSDNGIIVNPG